jgi:hypothetical protein
MDEHFNTPRQVLCSPVCTLFTICNPLLIKWDSLAGLALEIIRLQKLAQDSKLQVGDDL